jgi:hypothetical protein
MTRRPLWICYTEARGLVGLAASKGAPLERWVRKVQSVDWWAYANNIATRLDCRVREVGPVEGKEKAHPLRGGRATAS